MEGWRFHPAYQYFNQYFQFEKKKMKNSKFGAAKIKVIRTTGRLSMFQLDLGYTDVISHFYNWNLLYS